MSTNLVYEPSIKYNLLSTLERLGLYNADNSWFEVESLDAALKLVHFEGKNIKLCEDKE